MIALAARYDNAWLGIHGQSLTMLETMIQSTDVDRLLFGTDWPFYHLGASLAKVLITTAKPERKTLRQKICATMRSVCSPDYGISNKTFGALFGHLGV